MFSLCFSDLAFHYRNHCGLSEISGNLLRCHYSADEQCCLAQQGGPVSGGSHSILYYEVDSVAPIRCALVAVDFAVRAELGDEARAAQMGHPCFAE